MITMAHSVLARKAPDVSFVHNFPGAVKTNFGKEATGMMAVARTAPDESSALQLYGATSAAFPPAAGDAAGVPLPENAVVSVGTDGRPGSGSYNIDDNCEKASRSVQERLAQAKADGVEERLWAHVVSEIKDITGQDFHGL
jgi:hypothetical protein